MKTNAFERTEVDSAYVDTEDRYVVSLIVGYAGDTTDSPREAAAAALSLTRDGGSGDTTWFVYDRLTGLSHEFEQADIDPDFA